MTTAGTAVTRVRFVIVLEAAPGVDAVRGLKHTLRFAWRWCGLKCVYAAEIGTADDRYHGYADLFRRLGLRALEVSEERDPPGWP
jgi:hypothetical protein